MAYFILHLKTPYLHDKIHLNSYIKKPATALQYKSDSETGKKGIQSCIQFEFKHLSFK